MSARALLRTGVVLGARTAPRLSGIASLGVWCLALVLYLAFRAR